MLIPAAPGVHLEHVLSARAGPRGRPLRAHVRETRRRGDGLEPTSASVCPTVGDAALCCRTDAPGGHRTWMRSPECPQPFPARQPLRWGCTVTWFNCKMNLGHGWNSLSLGRAHAVASGRRQGRGLCGLLRARHTGPHPAPSSPARPLSSAFRPRVAAAVTVCLEPPCGSPSRYKTACVGAKRDTNATCPAAGFCRTFLTGAPLKGGREATAALRCVLQPVGPL